MSFENDGHSLVCQAERVGNHEQQLTNLKESQGNIQDEIKGLRVDIKVGQEELREDIREMVKTLSEYIKHDIKNINEKIENNTKEIRMMKIKAQNWDCAYKVSNVVEKAFLYVAGVTSVGFLGYVFHSVFAVK